MTWLNRFMVWLGVSKPKGRKAELEDWLEAQNTKVETLRSEQETARDKRGGFRQRLKTDRALADLPPQFDFHTDVYEAPVDRKARTTRFGYTMTYTVVERDGSAWILTIDPESGETPEWKEVKRVDIR